ncbi:papilin-like [Limulus polyphemus]|uniref:Papilin-like n=1 Tax=Limulus polyphemus TaxID=6850 RepID=A0ABM1T9R6_LIMPO|nr:papilin-like [Limulus polyphemus]
MTIKVLYFRLSIIAVLFVSNFGVRHRLRHEYHRREKNLFYPQNISVGIGTGIDESGPWGPWTENSQCSRSCGGGVTFQTRTCTDLSGFIFSESLEVVSTKPQVLPGGVFAEPVGCDMILGSNAKEDKCRVCGGDGSSCRTVTGVVSDDNLRVGYNDIILIPVGSTNIKIRETKPTNNYLAVRDMTGHYYLNGNWRIVFPKVLKFAGTVFHYERKSYGYLSPEFLWAPGPTTKPVFIVLLYQEKNPGIKYEYSVSKAVRSTQPDTYSWTFEEFGTCSRTCGGGFQRRSVRCVRTNGFKVVPEYLCDPLLMPSTNRTCNKEACPARWFTGEWGNCSRLCGSGVQFRLVYCHQLTENGVVVAYDKQCEREDGSKPSFIQQCTTGRKCPVWHVGPWTACNRICGNGNQTRLVTCRRNKEEVLDSMCDPDSRPITSQSCNLGPCEGVEWILSEWSGCDTSCGLTMESREVQCANKEGKVFLNEMCDKNQLPEISRPCMDSPPCESLWFASEWSECSAKCGEGIQTRSVFCGYWKDDVVVKAPESQCNINKKYAATQNCTAPPCKALWFTGPWNRCSVPCGGGERTRKILCISEDDVVSSKNCDAGLRPYDKEPCKMHPCDEGICIIKKYTIIHKQNVTDISINCMDTLFGCCPDNVTIADGPNGEGCVQQNVTDISINCMDTLFGCCPDNVTIAGGPNGEGCVQQNVTKISINCMETPYGCCLDNVTAAEGPDGVGCPVMNLTSTTINCSESLYGCCLDNTTLALGPDMEGCEVFLPAGHDFLCLLSPFGCCPDGFTSAEGPDNQGCCLVTEYGCCQDNITAAQGPSFEGCKEIDVTEQPDIDIPPNCSKFPFGCCPDGISPSQGPNDEGCCVTTQFGCCPDNLTAAMGPDNLGCGCQTFPYGCCPDDITPAMGPRYIGCSCKEYPFGCCQDGYFPANGPNFEGCICDRLLYGCCDDGVTPAIGHNKEGCGCETTKFGCCPDNSSVAVGPQYQGCACDLFHHGCCPDGNTPAKGPYNEGCPCETLLYGCCPDKVTQAIGPGYEGCGCMYDKHGCCPDGRTSAKGPGLQGCPCDILPYGCCPDKKTAAKGLDYEGCPCETFHYGCCPDRQTPAEGQDYEGSSIRQGFTSCETFQYGCCPDRQTPAEGPNYQGCPCETLPYGCCPDRQTPAEGPNYQGCPCETLPYGCCPDKQTPAQGLQYHGCPCNTLLYGCCPDKQTPAKGPELQGCPCESFSNGCCPDRKTPAEGPNYKGCPCSTMPYGCCPDGVIVAKGPHYEGCSCVNTPYRCCPDGIHVASGPNFEGCPDIPIIDQKVAGDVCKLPKALGPCRDYSVKWFFDMEYGGCTRFWYGGCNGNENRFDSEEKCKDICVEPKGADACALPKVEGSCNTPYKAWYFNTETRQCELFTYSGCLGNNNRFISKEMCEKTCITQDFLHVCQQPLVVGPCRGSFSRWYYDKSDDRCKQFKYGGCKGNENNFPTESQCQTQCTSFTAKGRDICLLPKQIGNCFEFRDQWFYDAEENECQKFTYSGCGGNGNNFNSAAECQERCGKPTSTEVSQTFTTVPVNTCAQPFDKGPCRGFFPQWYYDSRINICKRFIYGGCEGNSNRFSDRRECELRCVKKPTEEKHATTKPVIKGNADVCSLSVDPGTCSQSLPRWFFDPKSQQCLPFVYSGCKGNKNRFKSYEFCMKFCTESTPVLVNDNEQDMIHTSVLPYEPTCPSSNCGQLQCTFGIDEYKDQQGCTFCRCYNPCQLHNCEEGERCVVRVNDNKDDEARIEATCQKQIKPGQCPSSESFMANETLEIRRRTCRHYCRDDADCLGSNKCCFKGCTKRCTVPTITTTTIPTTTEEETVKSGSRVVFSCLSQGVATSAAKWTKDSMPVDFISGRFQKLSDGSLQINPVKSKDSGLYKCESRNEFEGQMYRLINMTVQAPVHIIPGPKVIKAKEGASCMLPCNAVGFPRPSVTWWRFQKMLPLLSTRYKQLQNYSLLIYSVIQHDQGQYTCLAHNGIGPTALWETTLIIERHMPNVDESELDVVSEPTMKTRELNSQSLSTLQTTTENTELDVAHHELYENLEVKVSIASKEYKTGSSLQLDCKVTGPEDTSVEWYLDTRSSPIQSNERLQIFSNNSLIIQRAEQSDSGVYRCEAKSKYSEASSSLSLIIEDVYIPPQCTDDPQFASCDTIVRVKYCTNPYYGRFCCRSCRLAGQLPPKFTSPFV